MSLSDHVYKRLYILQDKVFEVLNDQLVDYYLTGGTALGRFYLYHRFSDDLDFFTNHNAAFTKQVNFMYQLLQKQFDIDTGRTVLTPEYVRIWLKDETGLKLEIIAKDFLLAGENTLGMNKKPISSAKPLLIS